MTYLDSVYDAQRKDLVRKALDQIKDGTFRLELFLSGHHLVGGSVDEVEDVARRLQRLARPPAVEAGQPAKAEEPRRAA